MAKIHDISMSTCPLKMIRVSDDDEVVASGDATGFFWLHNSQWFIITNWHVVTGVNADSGKINNSFIPNRMEISLKLITSDNGTQSLVEPSELVVNLYEGEKPLWKEHETGRNIDCVAIPVDLSAFANLANRALNTFKFQGDLAASIGIDCFIIGYPNNLEGRARTPIWKRASVATEPDLNHDDKPMLLVDTASRHGMSGSPVIIRQYGIHENDGGGYFGNAENFLGVYSGRLGADELSVQLGRVWKASVIAEILNAGRDGVHPNDAD